MTLSRQVIWNPAETRTLVQRGEPTLAALPVILSFFVPTNKRRNGRQFGGRGQVLGQILLGITERGLKRASLMGPPPSRRLLSAT